MRRSLASLIAILLALAWLVSSSSGADKLRVVTTIPDLKSLAEAVGGDLIEVDPLTRGTQNFHEAEVRPSMMLKLRRADVLIENGLDLDAWVDVAVLGANNPKIIRGAPGRVDVSRGIPVLEVPGLAPLITQTILDGLARLAPDHRAAFERSRREFLSRLDGEMSRWTTTMEPLKGAKIVVFHPDFIYFVHRFALVQAGTVEDKPGIPPSPQHVVRLIRQIKEEKIKVILVEPWNDVKLAQRIAEEAGAKAIVFASAVGAVKGADNYIAAIDYNIKTLAEALR